MELLKVKRCDLRLPRRHPETESEQVVEMCSLLA